MNWNERRTVWTLWICILETLISGVLSVFMYANDLRETHSLTLRFVCINRLLATFFRIPVSKGNSIQLSSWRLSLTFYIRWFLYVISMRDIISTITENECVLFHSSVKTALFHEISFQNPYTVSNEELLMSLSNTAIPSIFTVTLNRFVLVGILHYFRHRIFAYFASSVRLLSEAVWWCHVCVSMSVWFFGSFSSGISEFVLTKLCGSNVFQTMTPFTVLHIYQSSLREVIVDV